jgi:hypothetical protein
MNTVHAFTITVDGELLEIIEHELTPAEIMSRAGIDPATNYLLEIIHEKLQFVSVNTGPKPVS